MVCLAVCAGVSTGPIVLILTRYLGDHYFRKLQHGKAELIAKLEEHWLEIVAAVEAEGGKFLDSEAPAR